MTPGIDPRADAAELVGDRAGVRVLEPSLPPVTAAPWFADDPVNAPSDHDVVVSPLPNTGLTWDALADDDPRLAPFCADHWLGAWRALHPVPDRTLLARTRRAWHAAAERILAPSRAAATGRIGLRFTVGGFGTPFFAHAGASVQLRVAGAELLVVRAGTPHTITRVALGDAARTAHEADAAVVSSGAAVELGYHGTTTASPDVLGAVDAGSAAVLADWFGFGCSVLEELRAESEDAAGTRCQLWPEHLDLAVELGDADAGQRATFGASPGDTEHPEPYLYVSPWEPPSTDGSYWDDTAFAGASLPYSALTGEPAAARAVALEFLRAGREILARG